MTHGKIDIKKIIFELLQYVIVFLLIINCRSMYLSLTTTPKKLPTLILCTTLLAIACSFLVNEKNFSLKSLKNLGLSCSFFICYFMIYLLFQNVNQKAALKSMVVFFAIFVYVKLLDNNNISKLLKKYSDIMFIIAIISLILWVCGPMLSLIKPSGKVWSLWSESGNPVRINNYYYLLFESQESSLAGIIDKMVRNTAIFTEAPMASYHFMLAFFLEICFEDRIRRGKCVVFGLAVVTTLSVTGYVVLIAYLIMRLAKYKPNKNYMYVLKIIIFIAIAIVGIWAIYYLFVAKSETKSGSMRKDDFIVCFKTWVNYPIFGCGIGNNKVIASYMSYWRTNKQGLANSPGQILAQGGLWIFVLYFYGIFKPFVKALKNKDRNMVLFIVMYSFMFLVTVVSYSYLTFYVICWICSRKDRMIVEKSIGRFVIV